MPRVANHQVMSFDIGDIEVERALAELRKVDKDLFNQMRREMRGAIRPIATDLKGNIPRGGSPLSGMSRSNRIARTNKSPDERSPFVWKLPGTSIDIGSRRSGRRGSRPIVRIRFTDKRPFSAFSVLETARQAGSIRGRNMISGINSKYPTRGKGRWVIEQFYDRKPEIQRIVALTVAKYSRQVSRRIRRQTGGR